MYQLQIWKILLLYYVAIDFHVEAKVTVVEYDMMPPLFHLDDFDKCMHLGKQALYCKVTFQVTAEDEQNKSLVWNIIQDVSSDPRNYRHDLLRHGICVPKSCPMVEPNTTDKGKLADGLSSCYSSKYEYLGLKANVTELHCETDEPYHPIDNYDVAVAIGLGVLIWMVVFASFYEGLARYKPKKEYDERIGTKFGRIMECFSLPANWSRLRKSTSEGESLKHINGFRFYNIQLVILAHVSMIATANPVLNTVFVENMTRMRENMLFVNGSCAVQTFMLITGFLLTYNFLLIFEKHKKFQLRYLILSFVNRYIRLTPCLLVVVAVNSTWLYHLNRGPIWDNAVGTEYRNCRSNWWVNLLYLNNIFGTKNMCMMHSWYLAADTQLFIVSLIVIGLMWKYQNRIKLILALSLIIGIAMPAIVNYYHDFDIVLRQYPEAYYHLFQHSQQWITIYASTITNFGGYAIGMTFGYIYYLNSKSNTKILTNKIYQAIWWVVVWGMPLGVIYYGLIIYQDDYQYTRIGAALYVTLHRNLFALGICLAIYGLTEGIGWFKRDCSVWEPVQVLGRLTYSVYLVHVSVIRVRGGQARTLTYMSSYFIFTNTFGDAVMSYICATLLALFVEFPVSALQKLMVPQLAKEKNAPDANAELKEKAQ